jgi:hypothetical protein
MELHFRNHTSSELWVAIMFYSPDSCGNLGNWGTRGWWPINPGGEAYVLNTNNRYAAFYGESASNLVWNGPYGPVYVHQQAFDSCVGIGDNNPNTRIVGMQLVDMQDTDSHYVNLVEE